MHLGYRRSPKGLREASGCLPQASGSLGIDAEIPQEHRFDACPDSFNPKRPFGINVKPHGWPHTVKSRLRGSCNHSRFLNALCYAIMLPGLEFGPDDRFPARKHYCVIQGTSVRTQIVASTSEVDPKRGRPRPDRRQSGGPGPIPPARAEHTNTKLLRNPELTFSLRAKRRQSAKGDPNETESCRENPGPRPVPALEELYSSSRHPAMIELPDPVQKPPEGSARRQRSGATVSGPHL